MLTTIQGCFKASTAVILFCPSMLNILLIRSLASSVTVSHSGEGYWGGTVHVTSQKIPRFIHKFIHYKTIKTTEYLFRTLRTLLAHLQSVRTITNLRYFKAYCKILLISPTTYNWGANISRGAYNHSEMC